MSIFIFTKEGFLYKIASSQSVYDANKNWPDDLYEAITVDNTDYTEVKLNTKSIISKNGNQITYANVPKYFFNQDTLISYINSTITTIEEWLESNDSKPLASNVTLYLNYLKSIDISSFTYPLNYSLESYVEDQGITAIHPLELL